MKKFILIFLFTSFLYGQDEVIKDNRNRMRNFYGIAFGFNSTNLIDNVLSFQYERDMLGKYYDYGFSFFQDNDIYLFTTKKLQLELAFSNRNAYINKDFKEEDAITQRYISVAIGLRPVKYFKFSQKFSLYASCGIEYNFNFGQSIFYEQNTRNDLKGNNYSFWNIIPEIGFLASMLKSTGEIYLNCTYSLNKAKPYINSDNEYRIGIINIGTRTAIF